MALRRVTFSGRLLRNHAVGSDESFGVVLLKGVFAFVLDIAIASGISVFAFFALMRNYVAPYERGFYCYQIESLSNPFVSNTVPTSHLLAITIFIPFIFISTAEAVFLYEFGLFRPRILKKYFFVVTQLYLRYLISYAILTLSVEMLKCMFGRLRPHFLSVCQPDWSFIDCVNQNNFINKVYCAHDKIRATRIARQSFPSGHSAAATHFLSFTYFYFTELLRASKVSLLRYLQRFTVLTTSLWTAWVLITRVTDYWHFPTDVIAGSILSVVIERITLYPILTDIRTIHKYREIEDPNISRSSDDD